MSKDRKDTEDALYKIGLDTHLSQKFNSEMGSLAKVNREEINNSLATRSNSQLRDLGAALNPIGDTLKYMGSTAVHIYESEMLGQIFYVSQTEPMQDVHELTGSKAIDDLRSSLMEFYGRKAKRKRSGF